MNRREGPKSIEAQRSEGAFVRYFVRVGWLHLTLVTCALIFTFPFLWMVETSLRTDEELVDPDWLPEIPALVGHSPYVRKAPTLVRPLGVTGKQWDEVLPDLLAIAKQKAEAETGKNPEVRADRFAASTAAVAVNMLAPRIASTTWEIGPAAVKKRFDAMLTPEVLADAMDDRLARLELRGIQIRTYDEHIMNVVDGPAIAGAFTVEKGTATLERKTTGTWVKYHFASADDGPMVLRYDFELPCDARDLHKLLISYRNDNSWHRENVSLDVSGHHWEGERINYMGQNRPGSWIYQPPGPDDYSLKKRVWVTFKDGPTAGGAPSDRHATLRIVIYPSSTARAILGKVQWNYRRAFDWVPFWTYVRNSAILVILSAAGTLFSSSFVAYSFARLNWPGKSAAFVLLLSTMMLPAQVTMIPSFMIWRSLGWYNTLNPLWVPSWCGVAFFIFLMTQHMKTIPRDLEEAARIDGLNAVQTWWYIIVPLVRPAAAAVAIMTVQGAWNEFMGPLIYLRDQSKFPLSLGIFGIRADSGATGAFDWTMLMASNVMMTLPMIVMFLLFQRYFVKGMALSGMKG